MGFPQKKSADENHEEVVDHSDTEKNTLKHLTYPASLV